MIKSPIKINKSINDVAWNQFINFISYKAEEAGRIIVKIDPKYTSQMCSRCGILVKKDLGIRIHKCDCGLVIDRDINAAINILRLGLQSLGKQSLKASSII
jgi:putative transposase